MDKRIIVAGGRDFNNAAWMNKVLDAVLTKLAGNGDTITIIEGEAPGADTLAKLWTGGKCVGLEPHPAKWRRDDGSQDLGAGHARNKEMADANAYGLVAFWNKKSPGTKNMLETARSKGLIVWEINY